MCAVTFYFAYGSNMSSARLRARVPGVQRMGVYELAQHTLCFHKRSVDGSAKCDAFFTGDSERILGVLYEIDPHEKQVLDLIEGLGQGYAEKQVQVRNAAGQVVTASTYYAVWIDAALQPYDWYVRHVLTGAREAGLPPDYIAMIASVVTIADPDRVRDARERSI